MNKNLHTLLAGPLYINEMYGASLVPSIYRTLIGNSIEDKSIEQLMIEKQSATEKTSVNSSANKVVVVDFNQPVLKFDYGYWLGTKTYTKILNQLANDDTVAGVVLNMDSGGGQVYGTPEFYDYISNYPKPIVAYTDGYMCSGAYYIAAATQRIFANKRADAIGSIGAYATIVDSNGIWEHFGAKVHTIYATKSTEKNSEYREVIDNSNYEPYIKNQLDPIVETFITDMKESRPNISEEAFKGGTWTGEQSVEMGLVDENGTIQDAINHVFELSMNSNNQKPNTNMNTKSLPKVEAVLSLEAPLALNENGSFLNEEQLDTIEARFDALESENSTLQTQVSEANTEKETAVNAITAQLTEATNTATAMETSVNAIMENLGLPVAGTLTEKLAAIDAKSIEVGKKDGAAPTAPKIGVDGEGKKSTASLNIAGVDVAEALNC
ncbi:MAG: S49 family peptidase [Flavobacterium sp.]|uniref:S49 family peptidase n=1 Tax=Flavobacterium sp. TaxID=239 RepID=UPI002B4A7085|nr:S49 family peptidase [Flavobacterium sp.]WRH73375.1 MAG: S49 family peptidase [Flavobacterium sp.]